MSRKHGISNIGLLLVVAALFVVTAGCNQFRSFIEKNRRVFIVFIDYSASNNEFVLGNYIRIINETIFSNMSRYDCLVVLPIDEGSKMQPVKLISIDLADTSFKKPNDGFAHANDSIGLRFKNYVKETAPKIEQELKEQKLKRKIYTGRTDIIGALQQASNLIEFNADNGAVNDVQDFVSGHVRLRSENVIVILSDMIQDSDDFSFNSIKGVTFQQAGNYLKELEKQNRIPGLDSCKVFAIGATGKNSAQIDNINFFWKEYFAKSKAELMAYGYSVDDKLRKYLKQTDDW